MQKAKVKNVVKEEKKRKFCEQVGRKFEEDSKIGPNLIYSKKTQGNNCTNKIKLVKNDDKLIQDEREIVKDWCTSEAQCE